MLIITTKPKKRPHKTHLIDVFDGEYGPTEFPMCNKCPGGYGHARASNANMTFYERKVTCKRCLRMLRKEKRGYTV